MGLVNTTTKLTYARNDLIKQGRHHVLDKAADMIYYMLNENDIGGTISSAMTFTADAILNDDVDVALGTSSDTILRWSDGDASNHAFVIGIGDTSQQMHITDKAAVATDWARAAGTHPELAIHSNTTPATDYLAIGNHDGTNASINMVGGTGLDIQIDDVGLLRADNAAVASFAAATDAAGAGAFLETQDGGTDGGSASTGQAGGAWSMKCGDGSAAVTTGAVGGAGGALTLQSGTGLTGETAGNGGVGGAVAITAAAGGASGAGAGVGGTGGTVTITAGAGGGAGGGTAGAPGSVTIGAGVVKFGVQTIDMADSPVTLTLVPGTPAGTLLTGNILYVDANGNTENLLLPHEADCTGLFLVIENTGGETITVQNDAAGAVVTLETANVAYCACDGTSWTGSVGVP
tara:strand:+ start:8986 stop:10200 length:1215 start_codon:yes stop_codon:yes gene_type:complete